MNLLRLLFALFTLLSSAPAMAGIYSFGGSCASIGDYSRTALRQTETIVDIVEKLKDNPDCKGIEAIVPQIKIAQNELKTPEAEGNRQERMESLPNEISALRNFAIATPELKNDVMKLLTSRTMEGASIAVEVAKEGAPAAAATAAEGAAAVANPATAIALGLSSLADRTRRATLTGLDMVDQIMTTLPTYDRCLIGRPDQGMALISAAVKLTASFVSSQDGVATHISTSLGNLINMMRNRKFTTTLRSLDESEFWISMSCLMEATAQTYCSARDGRKLLDYGIRSLRPKDPKKPTGSQNPLEGYYVLTRHVPNVSRWLQKIQFGITPKLSTDAKFKNNVWNDVTDLMTSINTLRGFYSEQMLTYSTLTTEESKKNFILELLKTLTDRLAGGFGEGGGGGSKVNFFTMSIIREMIPFRLVGLKDMPDALRPDPKNNRHIDWDDWMLDGGHYRSFFDKPDLLASNIGQNVEGLIDAALAKASLYFQQRMTVDMSALVSESVTSQTFTVVQSLKFIENYLTNLERKIIDNDGDLILVPNIRNTRIKIQKVLATYEEIRKLVKETIHEETENDDRFIAAYKKVVEAAYEQFNILLQRDTLLSTRLNTFVNYDYAWRIKNNEDMTPYEHDLLVESGKDLLVRLLGATGENPTNLANDLSAAQVINKRNLGAIEGLFKDSLYPLLQELDMVAKGLNPNEGSLDVRTLGRLFQDSYHRYTELPNAASFVTGNWLFEWAMGPYTFPGEILARKFMHPDLYPFHLTPYPVSRGADDEFKSFEQFKSKLCVQTLSFEDRAFFEPICGGSVLKSAFDKDTIGNRQLNLEVNYDAFMQEPMKSKPVTADSICAFQLYNRRNLVYWMTLDLDQQQ